MSRIIPETVNELGMAEAFRFYRDVLKLHVYPVDGTWSKKADPGKKPSVHTWWSYNSPDTLGKFEFSVRLPLVRRNWHLVLDVTP